LTAPDRDFESFFGFSVAISGDLLVVGAPGHVLLPSGLPGDPKTGAAFVYRRERLSRKFSLETQFVASDREMNDYFGYSVAVVSKSINSVVLVGAPFEDAESSRGVPYYEAGSVFVFLDDFQFGWKETQKVVAQNRVDGDNFGFSLSAYGDYLFVGAPKRNGGGAFETDRGAVFIYKEEGVWGNYNYKSTLQASNAQNNYQFGYSISTSPEYLLVGSPFGRGLTGPASSGACYLFKNDGADNWTEEQIIQAKDPATLSYFGYSVDIKNDALIVGAPAEKRNASLLDAQNGAGAAYVFKPNPTTQTWEQEGILTSLDRNRNDSLGVGVAIGESGDFAFAGAPNVTLEGGAVYFFEADFTSDIVSSIPNIDFYPNPSLHMGRLNCAFPLLLDLAFQYLMCRENSAFSKNILLVALAPALILIYQMASTRFIYA
jgi:hypothetical protein